MNKDKLQQELLEKVKPGMKPSDLKRPIPQPQVKDEGYESDKSDQSIPKAPPLPNQQIQSLQSQITSLKKQLQTYKDFKEADLKHKEKRKRRCRLVSPKKWQGGNGGIYQGSKEPVSSDSAAEAEYE